MSLRVRLAAALALAFAAILILGAVLFHLQAEKRLADELGAARAVAANRVAALIAGLPAASDVPLELSGFVRSFNGDRHVQVLLIDPSGAVRAASSLSTARDTAPRWFVARFDARARTIVMPLSAAALPISAVAVVTDPAAEIGELWADLALNLFLLVLLLASSVILLFVVAGRSLKPLDAMRAGVAAIGAGGAGVRVPETGPPELAALARGFNAMAERLREMASRNARLSEQLGRMQEEERAELARDLHDEVGPALFAVDVDAAGIERLTRGGLGADAAPKVIERAAAIRRSAADAKLAVRRLLGTLRPGRLPGLGLAAAIRELAADLSRRHPDVAFALELGDGEWGEAAELLVFRSVREAMNNALRHGRPTRVAVRLSAEDSEGMPGLVFCVTDDGGGLPETGTAGGYGLMGMAERLEAVGGALSVSQVPLPPGVRVEGRLPLPLGTPRAKQAPMREGRAA